MPFSREGGLRGNLSDSSNDYSRHYPTLRLCNDALSFRYGAGYLDSTYEESDNGFLFVDDTTSANGEII